MKTSSENDATWRNGTRKTTLQPDLTPSKRIGFAASPIDTARLEENQWKTRDSRRDMLEHQNEHVVQDFLQFLHFVFQNRCFPTSFPNEP